MVHSQLSALYRNPRHTLSFRERERAHRAERRERERERGLEVERVGVISHVTFRMHLLLELVCHAKLVTYPSHIRMSSTKPAEQSCVFAPCHKSCFF